MPLCATCPRYRPPVPSIGPTPCRVLLLGECPSKSEDRDGQPFTGPTGEELTTVYIPLTGWSRSDFHIANVRQCSFVDYSNPDTADAMTCASTNLSILLNQVKPEIIVPMGAVACSIFDGINFNMHHGILQPAKWGSWSGYVFPTFHPTAGMRTTSYMIPLMADFKKLGEVLQQKEITQSVDEINGQEDYEVVRSTNDLGDYLHSTYYSWGSPELELAEDTESLPDGSPYCLTFSITPGTGRLIYATEKRLLVEYAGMVKELDPLHIFHNYLHDVIPFEQWSIPITKFRDTMVMAYNLCLGGGGDDEDTESKAGRGSLSLKVLSYRHLAMTMTSFKDTVTPHSLPYVLDWMKRGRQLLAPGVQSEPLCETCGHERSLHEPRGKTQRNTGPCRLIKGTPAHIALLDTYIQHMNFACTCPKWKTPAKVVKDTADKPLTLLHRKLNTIITNIEQGKLDSKGHPADPWHRYNEWPDYDHTVLLDNLGPLPLRSIEHVPEPELLNYAVRDPDATLRLYYYLVGLTPWIYYD